MAEPESPAIIDVVRAIERELTAPGAPFEITEVEIAGHPVRTYRHGARDLAEILTGIEHRFAGNTLTVGAETHTYAEVFDRARRLAGLLHRRHGIGAGDRVGIAMANQPSYLVALFAVARLGAVAVLYNSRGSTAELAAALDDVPSPVIIADPARMTLLRGIALGTALLGTAELDALLADAADGPEHPVRPEAECLILFTSGTSGRAKGVRLTHRNITHVVLNMRYVTECNLRIAAHRYGIPLEELRGLVPPVSTLLIFPLFHVSGLAGLFSALGTGGAVATMTRWDPEVAAGLIHDHRLTMMSGPPMTVDELLRVDGVREKLGSLVNLTPGGQATPPNLTARIAATLPVAQRSAGWGMTETAGSVCTAGGALLGEFPETAGPMSPTMQVRVVDADGAEVPVGTVGELELRGGLVMAGYVGAEPQHGWLRTGDLGYLDEHGLVYLVDRSKDIVISAGENIACTEVEAALMAGDAFTEVAAFGVPDERRGERVVVAVTLEPGVELDAEQVRELARRTLPEYKVPSEVLFDQSPLPRNATGKLLKRELRRRYAAR
ncbi:class I adenylate-forming enzyme family protein [Nocardia sp. NPDC057353]|uniref:class I adenylate-forming enzyme family protein n=1 Tax=Nocardia sp. NPDC057353 TaxID=3346104 RepID=UPI00363BC156